MANKIGASKETCLAEKLVKGDSSLSIYGGDAKGGQNHSEYEIVGGYENGNYVKKYGSHAVGIQPPFTASDGNFAKDHIVKNGKVK